ncbi:hypothetical protein D3C80_2192080 [compost metagenome]
MELFEINATYQQPQRWHDDVGNQGRNDFTECRTNDHTHCQIDHVATHGKFAELF